MGLAWVLSDKIGSKELELDARDQFNSCMELIHVTAMPEAVGFVFEKMPERSPFRKYLMNHFVETFFSPHSGLDAFTQATAASKNFNNLVWKETKDHTLKEKKKCQIYNCTVHKPANEKDKN